MFDRCHVSAVEMEELHWEFGRYFESIHLRRSNGDHQGRLYCSQPPTLSPLLQFLQETFDAMFAILDAKTQQQGVSILVYNALVFMINFLVDEKKKYTNFRKALYPPLPCIHWHEWQVLDSYIANQFSGAMAHKHLMMCLKHFFDEIDTNPGSISKIIPTLKVTSPSTCMLTGVVVGVPVQIHHSVASAI